MKRDKDLLRSILLRVEESDRLGNVSDYGVDVRTFVGHVRLLDEAGLITGVEFDDDLGPSDEPNFHVTGWLRLTDSGHDFVELAQDPTAWEQAKVILTKAGRGLGNVTIEILQRVLAEIAVRSLQQ